MKQLKVSLPDDLRIKLEEASAAADHSLAEEIRVRLERTFATDATIFALDPKTRWLSDFVIRFAAEVKRETGAAWHEHLLAHGAFKSGLIARLIRLLDPKDWPALPPLARTPITSNDPATIGETLEYVDWRLREKLNQ